MHGSWILFSFQKFLKTDAKRISRYMNALEKLDRPESWLMWPFQISVRINSLAKKQISPLFWKEIHNYENLEKVISTHWRNHSNWILENRKISFGNSNKCTILSFRDEFWWKVMNSSQLISVLKQSCFVLRLPNIPNIPALTKRQWWVKVWADCSSQLIKIKKVALRHWTVDTTQYRREDYLRTQKRLKW